MMKLLVPTFLLGAIVGALGMYLLSQSSPSREAAGEPAAEGKSAERPKVVSRGSAEPRRSAASMDGPSTDSKRPRIEVDRDRSKVVVSSPDVDMQAVRNQMAKAEKERSAKRVNAKLAALVARLGLNENQAAKVRALLEKQEAGKGRLSGFMDLAVAAEEGDKINVGQSLSIVPDLLGSAPSGAAQFDAELREILHDDQLAAYDEYQEERRANQVEIKANQALTQLQRMLDLTPDQKDRAFDAFAQIAEEEAEAGGGGAGRGINLEGFQQQRAARKEAMSQILTPEQMAVYESSGGTAPIIFTEAGGVGGVGGVGGSIRIETKFIEVQQDAEE